MKIVWEKTSLANLIQKVIDYRGKTPLKLGGDWEENNVGYRALSAKNIKTGHIVSPETIRYVNQALYDKWMKDEILRGDILITSEAPFGEVYQWNSDEKIVLSQRLFAIRANNRIHAHYLYYYLTTHKFQQEMRARATGTTVIGLRQPELLKCIVYYPLDKTAQAQIASILQCIDRKIEINTSTNRNLEQQAQAIFKSWFVDFEPFQDGRFVDSELGPIPEGWRVGTLKDIALYNSEKLPASQAKHDTYVSTENMLPNRGGIELASSVPSTGCVTVFAKNDVLLSNIRPYFRKIWYASSSGTCSTDVLCFRTKAEVKSEYLFCVLNNEKFFEFIMSGAKGTKMPRGDKRQMMSYRIVMPPKDILENFAGTLKPLVDHQRRNTTESRRLSTLRDTLLPKLMSGEIDVSEVEV